MKMPLIQLQPALIHATGDDSRQDSACTHQHQCEMKDTKQDGLLQAGLQHVDTNLVDLAMAALSQRDFSFFINLFGSHQRLQVFLAIEAHLTDEEYWPLLREVWQFEDLFFPHKEIWFRLLTSSRFGREQIMETADREALEQMSAELEIFRGYTRSGHNGLSWTLSEATADLFAQLANGPRMQWFGNKPGVGKVISGKCRKTDVIAFFTDRDENEIVIDPKKVYSTRVRPARTV